MTSPSSPYQTLIQSCGVGRRVMSTYVDGVVIPVPTEALDAYQELAAHMGELWLKHGALAYFEGVQDEDPSDRPGPSMRTFPEVAGATEAESIVFAFIGFESRDHRDEVEAAVMEDPGMHPDAFGDELPFDPSRMVHGSFRSVVDLTPER